MLHKATIKSEVKKQFSDLEIIEIKNHQWGLFTVKVKQIMKTKTKIGLLHGETDHDNFKNGVKLDKNIFWI